MDPVKNRTEIEPKSGSHLHNREHRCVYFFAYYCVHCWDESQGASSLPSEWRMGVTIVTLPVVPVPTTHIHSTSIIIGTVKTISDMWCFVDAFTLNLSTTEDNTRVRII